MFQAFTISRLLAFTRFTNFKSCANSDPEVAGLGSQIQASRDRDHLNNAVSIQNIGMLNMCDGKFWLVGGTEANCESSGVTSWKNG